MKRSCRPWDKHRSFAETAPSTARRNLPDRNHNKKKDESVSYVTIRQKKYYCDRFYINKTIYDDDDGRTTSTGTDTASRVEDDLNTCKSETNRCRECRESSPSLLFDRAAFLQSYFEDDDATEEEKVNSYIAESQGTTAAATPVKNKLKAVIFGTYTVDDRTLQEEFPNLFIENFNNKCSNAHIPCLVLYGKRNTGTLGVDDADVVQKSKSRVEANPGLSPSSSSMDEEEDNVNTNCHDDDDNDSVSTEESALATQDEETTTAIRTAILASTTTTSHNSRTVVPNRTAPVNLPLRPVATRAIEIKAFPKTVHFSQITSSWYKNMNELLLSLPSSPTSNSAFDNIVDPSTGCLRPAVLALRTNVPFGVHHSKYMICFESDGSIVICIGTANLTSPQTTDATWIQRFSPATPTTTTKNSNSGEKGNPSVSNDFGRILTNYLQFTMLSTAANHVTIHWFVRTYLQWKSIRQLQRNYNFQAAAIQLMTVIPGEYPHANSTNANDKRTLPFLFGQERLSTVLQQLELSLATKSRNLLYTKNDRIVIQPTSFGGGWNVSNMVQLIRSYLGVTIQNDLRHNNDQDAMRRVDIVWPTKQFVETTKSQINCKTRQRNALSRRTTTDRVPSAAINATEVLSGGFLFCSSEAFNKTDLTCLNRMVMFEPNVEQPQHHGRIPLIPHFKSVNRVIEQRDAIRTKYPNLPHCDEYFSWFLLTSACLSRGAQGEATVRKNDDIDGTNETLMEYTNFEMGVLFSSYLSGERNSSHKSDRIYCWNSKSRCSCQNINGQKSLPQLIHLPVPYHLRPSRYVDDEDIAMFSDTPYFHEITPGTGCEGNMLLTPYGRDLAAKLIR